MKKTIVALMALAGVAMAESLTLTSPAGGSLTTSNAWLAWSDDVAELTSWELSFTLNVQRDALSALNLAVLSDSGIQFAIDPDGSVELYGGSVTSTNSAANFVSAVKTDTAITLQYIANEENGDIIGGTLKATSGSNVLSVDLTHELTLTSGDSGSIRLWTNSGNEQYSNITLSKLSNNVITTPAPAAPEPTTATLSLLALAGLAARRRRK